MKILLALDDPSDRLFLSRLLVARGDEAAVAMDAAGLHAQARSGRFDAVLLGTAFGGEDGRSVLAGLHAGRLVLAHPLAAYAPYAEFAWIGEDLCAGIEWSIRHPREALERIARGQAFIDQRHSPQVVARFWLNVFDRRN